MMGKRNPIRMCGFVDGIKTSIICTLAPSQIQTVCDIKNFVKAGMRIVRLNFSHIEEFNEKDKEGLKEQKKVKNPTKSQIEKLESLLEKEKRDRKYAWRLIKLIRKAEKEMKTPIGVMMDLCGPRLRTGRIGDPKLEIIKEGSYTFTSYKIDFEGDKHRCNIPPDDFTEDNNFVSDINEFWRRQEDRLTELKGKIERGLELTRKEYEEIERIKQGLFIYVNDGRLKFKVEGVDDRGVHCTVMRGGKMETRKGINVPYCRLHLPPITQKDEMDLRWVFDMEGKEKGNFKAIDYVALSFVKEDIDIHKLRGILARRKRYIPVIAKIETPEALENLKTILEASDGLMVARGDLGVEISLAKVPKEQRRIIRQSVMSYGEAKGDYDVGPKFVIVATQMLESMITDVQPLRAEVSDINTAIYEGADAIMTSAETINAEEPIEVVKRMAEIAREAEVERDDNLECGYRRPEIDEQSLKDRIAAQYFGLAESACILAQNKSSPAIVVSSWSGRGAKIISSFIPRPMILAITDNESTIKHLLMYKGICPVLIKPARYTKHPASMRKHLRLMQEVLRELYKSSKGKMEIVGFFGIDFEKPPTGKGTVSNTLRLFGVM